MKKELYGLFAGEMPRVNWLLGLNTLIRGLKDYQEEITSERDSLVTEMAKRKLRDSATNSEIAKSKRKGVTREDLERLRCEYMLVRQRDHDWPEGRDHGWKEYALGENRLPVRITRKTLDARWKEK